MAIPFRSSEKFRQAMAKLDLSEIWAVINFARYVRRSGRSNAALRNIVNRELGALGVHADLVEDFDERQQRAYQRLRVTREDASESGDDD